MPADDLTDPAPATTFSHLDATTVLSRKITELGIYPAVDPLESTSRILDPNVVGQEHYDTAQRVKQILQRNKELQDIISILGMDELSDEDRQSLLESPGLLARARKLLEILVREQQLVELKNEIQSRVKQEIDKQQRDYYLQQQMRTIQDELGEGADSELEGLREKASKKNWPKEVAELFEKEITKLERLNPAVAEYSVQVTYLQLMLELPWNDVT